MTFNMVTVFNNRVFILTLTLNFRRGPSLRVVGKAMLNNFICYLLLRFSFLFSFFSVFSHNFSICITSVQHLRLTLIRVIPQILFLIPKKQRLIVLYVALFFDFISFFPISHFPHSFSSCILSSQHLRLTIIRVIPQILF